MLKMSKNFINSQNGFRQATDDDLDNGLSISKEKEDNMTMEYNQKNMEDYLRTYVSGERYYPKDGEMITQGGTCILPFFRVKEMVEDGYNIIKGELIGGSLVDLEYQKIEKIEKGMGK